MRLRALWDSIRKERADALRELEILLQREIPGGESRTSEGVPAQGAVRAGRRLRNRNFDRRGLP